jgi:hypothetical protein
MGRFDYGGMACIMPFTGTYHLLWEYGARKARLALEGGSSCSTCFITGSTPDTVYVLVLEQVAYTPGIIG